MRLTFQFMLAGYAAWVGKYAEDDAVLVKLLLKAGAVPFVRTNLPQTIMVWACNTSYNYRLTSCHLS